VLIGVVDREDRGYLVGGSVTVIDGASITVETSLGSETYPLEAGVKITRMSDTGELTPGDVATGDYVILTVASAAEPAISEIQVVDLVYETVKGARLSGTVMSMNRRTGIAKVRASGGAIQRLHVKAGTLVLHADGRLARAADIRRGRYLEFDGATAGDGVIAASVSLFDRRFEAGIVGRMTAVDGGKRFVLRTGRAGRMRVVLTADTRILLPDGSRGTFSDVVSGSAALVDGTGGKARVVASRVRLLAGRGAVVRLEGSVVKAAKQSLQLRTARGVVRVFTGSQTMVARASGAPLSPANLREGMRLVVAGFRVDGRAQAAFVTLTGR
jgi:hypothetical protein